MTEDPRTVAEMLATHELALRQLYQAYAQRFPTFKDFWLQLANDEQHHANWLGVLLAKTGPSNPLDPRGWPRPAAIESCLKYVQEQILRAQRSEVTCMAALSIARDIENSLLEKRFFRVAEGASPQVKAVLGRLTGDTERHLQVVLEALNQARRDVPDPV